MSPAESKILTREAMRAERERLRASGKKLVFTNGAFDILHAGHVTYLQFARAQGDALCVGLNSDASVKRYKGDQRPVNPQADRALVLAALACVDYVVIFDEDEPKALIAELIPDVLVKGADWAHYVSGRDIVEAHGGKVVLAEMVEGRSTTTMITRIVEAYSPMKSSSPSPSPSSFPHERLICYQLAIELLEWLKKKTRIANASWADSKSQLERAALSIALNIAEGNGKREGRVRAKFFDDARGSAAECAACLDALVASGKLASDDVVEGKAILNRISGALTGLVKRFDGGRMVREGGGGYGEAGEGEGDGEGEGEGEGAR